MNEDKDPRIFHYTKNVIQSERFMGIQKRNIYEAIAIVVFLIVVIASLPFTSVVKTMSIIVLCPTTLIICIRGVKNRSIGQIITAEIKFRKNRRELHLRGPEYKREKGEMHYDENANDSIAEKGIRIVRTKINEFIGKYSDPEDSEHS